MGDVPPVTGVAHKHCNWDVPYKVGGSMSKLWTGHCGLACEIEA